MNARFLAGDVEASPGEAGRLEVSTEVRGAAERADAVDAGVIRCGASAQRCV